MCTENNILRAVGQFCLNKVVSLTNGNCIYSSASRVTICNQGCLFYYAPFCCHDNILTGIEFFDRDEGTELLFFRYLDKIHDCAPLGSFSSHR